MRTCAPPREEIEARRKREIQKMKSPARLQTDRAGFVYSIRKDTIRPPGGRIYSPLSPRTVSRWTNPIIPWDAVIWRLPGTSSVSEYP